MHNIPSVLPPKNFWCSKCLFLVKVSRYVILKPLRHAQFRTEAMPLCHNAVYSYAHTYSCETQLTFICRLLIFYIVQNLYLHLICTENSSELNTALLMISVRKIIIVLVVWSFVQWMSLMMQKLTSLWRCVCWSKTTEADQRISLSSRPFRVQFSESDCTSGSVLGKFVPTNHHIFVFNCIETLLYISYNAYLQNFIFLPTKPMCRKRISLSFHPFHVQFSESDCASGSVLGKFVRTNQDIFIFVFVCIKTLL